MEQPTTDNFGNIQDQLNQAHRELSVLYDVSNAMRTTLELHHIMYIILTGVTAHTGLGFNRAILFLVNRQERCLEAKMAIGPESGEHAEKIWTFIKESDQALEDLITTDRITQTRNPSSLYESVKNLRIALDSNEQSLLATAVQNGVPLLIGREELEKYSDDPLSKSFCTNEMIVVPLKGKEMVIGLIVADNIFTQKPITPADVRIFVMLANQAGLAIENSQLYEMIVHKSHTDSLTQVWNHGFFQHILSIEIEKAKSSRHDLTLLMIDIDNFKKLNDTYGHQNGDVVLQELAKVLKQSSRDTDYVCRYGGEEFSVILPQTNKQQGLYIAERIREEIAKFNFPKFHLTDDLNVTVSIGLAVSPENAETKEDLIAKADKAMYIAKFGGKNQTCTAQKENA